MQLKRMDEKAYAEFWDNESKNFDKQGVYEQLCAIAPKEDVLEIGCGNGAERRQLINGRKVLTIDNNQYLIAKAKKNLASVEKDPEILYADIFELGDETRKRIGEFSPKGIVAWLIGSHMDDVEKRTPANIPLMEKPKKYREAVEDQLLTPEICTASVEWIHLSIRTAMSKDASPDLVESTQKEDYDTHVFSNAGFKVTDVAVIPWEMGSDFMYAQAQNPNFMGGEPVPCVVSILARRVQK